MSYNRHSYFCKQKLMAPLSVQCIFSTNTNWPNSNLWQHFNRLKYGAIGKSNEFFFFVFFFVFFCMVGSYAWLFVWMDGWKDGRTDVTEKGTDRRTWLKRGKINFKLYIVRPYTQIKRRVEVTPEMTVFSESADCRPKWSATRPLLASYYSRGQSGHQELLPRS